ncbi:MAG: hemolysin family protein [Bacilli bacterium]|nr:hemolysin family protein [Bacilli bacterium]
MRPSSIAYIIAIVVLMVFSAFFSAADMAYSVVSRKRLKKAGANGNRFAKLGYDLAENYERTITTLLFGNNIVNILASSLGTVLAVNLAADNGFDESLTSLVVSLIMLLTILTFSEILPKAVARNANYAFARGMSPIVRFFQIIFFPIVKVTTSFASSVTNPIIKRHKKKGTLSDDELEIMVKELEESDVIDEDSSELISNSIEFKDTCAYEIVTPRVKIEGIEWGTNLNKYVTTQGAFKHSRIPVYKEDKDHIVGYIPVKTLLRVMLTDERLSIDDLMLPVINVPRTMEISTVLAMMKKTHHHLAVVMDEYGGTEGILTLEDILEELVGDMWDESEQVKPDIVKTKNRNHYKALGSANIDDVFDYFEIDDDILDSDYSTLSGWINDKLGRFAEEGDDLQVGKYNFIVQKVTDYTVEEVEIVYHPRRKVKED